MAQPDAHPPARLLACLLGARHMLVYPDAKWHPSLERLFLTNPRLLSGDRRFGRLLRGRLDGLVLWAVSPVKVKGMDWFKVRVHKCLS